MFCIDNVDFCLEDGEVGIEPALQPHVVRQQLVDRDEGAGPAHACTAVDQQRRSCRVRITI